MLAYAVVTILSLVFYARSNIRPTFDNVSLFLHSIKHVAGRGGGEDSCKIRAHTHTWTEVPRTYAQTLVFSTQLVTPFTASSLLPYLSSPPAFMSMHTQQRRVATCAALTHNQTHRHAVPTLVIHYNNGQHVVFTQHHDWAAARREDDMRRGRKAEVEPERQRGWATDGERERERRGGWECKSNRLTVYLLFIFYLNLAGREISASCQSRIHDWSPGRSNPPPFAERSVTPATPRSFFLQCHQTRGHVTLVWQDAEMVGEGWMCRNCA